MASDVRSEVTPWSVELTSLVSALVLPVPEVRSEAASPRRRVRLVAIVPSVEFAWDSRLEVAVASAACVVPTCPTSVPRLDVMLLKPVLTLFMIPLTSLMAADRAADVFVLPELPVDGRADVTSLIVLVKPDDVEPIRFVI